MLVRSTAVVFLALASGAAAAAAAASRIAFNADILPASRTEVPYGTKVPFTKRSVPATPSKIDAQGEASAHNEHCMMHATKKAGGTYENPVGRKLEKRDAVLGLNARDRQRAKKRLVRRFAGAIARTGSAITSRGARVIKDTAKWLLKNPTAISALTAAGGVLLKGAFDEDDEEMKRAMAAAVGGFATPFYGGSFPVAADGSRPFSAADNARIANAAAYGAAVAAAFAAGQPIPFPVAPTPGEYERQPIPFPVAPTPGEYEWAANR